MTLPGGWTGPEATLPVSAVAHRLLAEFDHVPPVSVVREVVAAAYLIAEALGGPPDARRIYGLAQARLRERSSATS